MKARRRGPADLFIDLEAIKVSVFLFLHAAALLCVCECVDVCLSDTYLAVCVQTGTITGLSSCMHGFSVHIYIYIWVFCSRRPGW